eukprot:2980930-Pleurochrysis_carterae.AAC.1
MAMTHSHTPWQDHACGTPPTFRARSCVLSATAARSTTPAAGSQSVRARGDNSDARGRSARKTCNDAHKAGV